MSRLDSFILGTIMGVAMGLAVTGKFTFNINVNEKATVETERGKISAELRPELCRYLVRERNS